MCVYRHGVLGGVSSAGFLMLLRVIAATRCEGWSTRRLLLAVKISYRLNNGVYTGGVGLRSDVHSFVDLACP